MIGQESQALRYATIGYASVDMKYLTAPFAGENRTTLVRRPMTDPEPGAVWYFSRALARRGCTVGAVTWVGSDAFGQRFIDQNAAADIDTRGISVGGHRSPLCHMFYSETGTCVTYFDPGALDQRLLDHQRAVIQEADVVLVGIGPAEATADALDQTRPDAALMWVVKADPGSMPPALARRLAARADVICRNVSEEPFLIDTCGLRLPELTGAGTLLVTTCGPSAVRVETGEVRLTVAAPERVDAIDATGAGDTFAGGLLARLASQGLAGGRSFDEALVSEAVRGACDDARDLLWIRTKEREHG